MTKIACVADLHENKVQTPECDILVVAGDITYGFRGDLPSQQKWIINHFSRWCGKQPAKEVVVVAGNHDQSVERWGWPNEGRDPDEVTRLGMYPCRAHYLQDTNIELFGLKIHGTPWQPYFYGWGFNAPERHGEEWLAEKFELIPDDTDILICHGPPYGYGDQVGNPHAEDRSGQPHAGSRALLEAIDRVQPRLMVCGHIHSGYGRFKRGETTIINGAIVNNEYKPVNEVMLVDL